MYFNHLRYALRRLLKHRQYTIITVVGLTVGLVAAYFLFTYVQHERTYDQVPGHERIFRVQNNYVRNYELIYASAATFAGVGPNMERYFAEEVEAYARFYPLSRNLTCNLQAMGVPGADALHTEELAYVDGSFLELFSVDMISGNAQSALSVPNRVVLSESEALRHFASLDVLGKTIRFVDASGQEDMLEVAGVFRPTDQPSHLSYSVLVSYTTLYSRFETPEQAIQRYEEEMGRYVYYTYVRLTDPTDAATIQSQFPSFVDHFKPSYLETNEAGDRIRRNDFTLVPLADVHLHSRLQNEATPAGNPQQIPYLLAIGVFLLILSATNYINLSTVQTFYRRNETGLRKVLGASRSSLMLQFFTETLLITGVSVVLAVTALQATWPWLNGLVGVAVLPSRITLSQVLSLGGLGLLIALLSGLYPALVMGRAEVLRSLKGKSLPPKSAVHLRQGVVGFQLGLSLLLMGATGVMVQQMRFLSQQELGFSEAPILVVERPAEVTEPTLQGERFRTALEKLPAVVAVGQSALVPGHVIQRGMFISRAEHAEIDQGWSIEPVFIGEGFMEAYELELLAGRVFQPGSAVDSAGIWLNASAIAEMGFTSPQEAINETLYLYGSVPRTILGVLSDYHQESLKRAKDPMMFYVGRGADAYCSIRLSSAPSQALMAEITEAYALAYPNNPLKHFFLQDFFDRQYAADQKLASTFQWFSGLAILIAALGILGLASFAALQRTKEMGIRKVLGASLSRLLHTQLRGFMLMLLVAMLVTMPILQWWSHSWLTDFPIRTSLGLATYLLPSVLLALVLVSVIGRVVWRAATANPAKVLRDE
ncbi:MAG TPA: hypothetical protein DCE41_14855 [Cytophagales bacterium]|nr:hypothetical protein [Cytophagales bacterium]HAP61259.1 hypothetical protein [Cytophagales bacterium]